MASTGGRQREVAGQGPPVSGSPSKPKLRPVDAQWVEHQGHHYVHLRDPLELSDTAVLIPQHLAPLIALCDGTRDVAGLQAGLALRTSIQLSTPQILDFLAGMDSALLLENGAFQRVSAKVLSEYREAEYRKPSHVDRVYPPDPEALSSALREYCEKASTSEGTAHPTSNLVGVVSPHIDYERGGETYARLWSAAGGQALEDVELAIIFGTDHSGGPGSFTLTRQNYATPLGVSPTDRRIVDGLADAIGPSNAFAEELHHISEHSIELALVWFQHFRNRPCPIVPVLCGSFTDFVLGENDPAEDERIGAVIELLRDQTKGRRTLVIAAGDLAHVGPAFGDHSRMDAVARARLEGKDAETIAAICDGDANALLALSSSEADARRICGLPPIYMALRLLGEARGQSVGYAQCPADLGGDSLVSITGVLLYDVT